MLNAAELERLGAQTLGRMEDGAAVPFLDDTEVRHLALKRGKSESRASMELRS